MNINKNNIQNINYIINDFNDNERKSYSHSLYYDEFKKII